MKLLVYIILVTISFKVVAQVIEVPTGTALTVQGNLNIPTGYSLQFNGQPFLKVPASGSFNTYLGLGAGSTGNGTQNTFLGYQAGLANATGTDNVFVGGNAGKSNTDGSFNLFVGGNAGQANTTGRENLFFGAGSGYTNTTGTFNTFVGLNSGFANTNGQNNVFFGQRAGFANTTGSFNMFMGASTGAANTTGVYNTFVGNGAGYFNQTGNNNTFVGLNSGFKTTSSDNVSIGLDAGRENTTGTRNTFIGTGAGVSAANPGLQNATAIGYGAQVSTSNSVILGNGANVGIGTSAPGNKLEITQGTAGNSGLRFTNLTSSSQATALSQTKFLTVDGSGNVVLGTPNSSGRLGAELWEVNGDVVQNTNAKGVVIGQGIDQTPAGYKLYVEDGILTEKVKVAVKSTADWSDKVFEVGYKLNGLSEVARYIKANKHLPGVPSAQQMVEQGNDLHKTDAKLLEKIEELTMYSIQLNRQNLKQQAEINELKRMIKQLMGKK